MLFDAFSEYNASASDIVCLVRLNLIIKYTNLCPMLPGAVKPFSEYATCAIRTLRYSVNVMTVSMQNTHYTF